MDRSKFNFFVNGLDLLMLKKEESLGKWMNESNRESCAIYVCTMYIINPLCTNLCAVFKIFAWNCCSTIVFKVSRNFSTRLTQSESFEIDSTHSTFDSKMTLYKNHIFVNFIFESLLANIFKIHNEKFKIVTITLIYKNDNFWI